MKIKQIAFLIIGVIVALLGLLWFLQGADIIHPKPLLCFANCEPITGKSSLWQIVGVIAFIVGTLIAGKSIKSMNRSN